VCCTHWYLVQPWPSVPARFVHVVVDNYISPGNKLGDSQRCARVKVSGWGAYQSRQHQMISCSQSSCKSIAAVVSGVTVSTRNMVHPTQTYLSATMMVDSEVKTAPTMTTTKLGRMYMLCDLSQQALERI
jgi:hypothetical protein